MRTLAIVTGGASGLGASTVAELERRGHHVLVLDVAPAAAPAENVDYRRCDVSSAQDVEAAVSAAVEVHGPPRILVNAAGVFRLAPLQSDEAVELAWLERTISINLLGAFYAMRSVVRHLAGAAAYGAGERGVIVNVASGGAFDGTAGSSAYAAAKGGLLAATLPLARELASIGVRVMTIAPGPMQTPMLDDVPEAMIDGLARQVPFPARLGQAEEFAALVAHILDNAFLNGSTIRLDGAHRLAFDPPAI